MPADRGDERVVVGLMSGTSLDGISSAVARFWADARGHAHVELLAMGVHPYDDARRARLARALTGATPAEYCRLSFDLADWLADAAIAVIAESGVPRAEIAAVASHGQTIWHEPGHSTWQLGEGAVIAERTGLDVIANFRARDMAAGGQGAPLVPAADARLFYHAVHWRALQNLGGIGNVSVVPPGGGVVGTRAFDTGPGVVLIDGVVRALVPGASYDEGGRLASLGEPIESVVDARLGQPYFASPPPKSTGRELFDATYVRALVDDCRAARPGASTEDVVATAVRLTARSIADAYRRFVPEPLAECVLSGGGAKNPALVSAIGAALADSGSAIEVRLFDDLYFDGEAKEAVAFAFLGWLHLTGRPGNVPGATGARGSRILGQRTPA
jgi:anhydro-N-acetylmuramic acid kinase